MDLIKRVNDVKKSEKKLIKDFISDMKTITRFANKIGENMLIDTHFRYKDFDNETNLYVLFEKNRFSFNLIRPNPIHEGDNVIFYAPGRVKTRQEHVMYLLKNKNVLLSTIQKELIKKLEEKENLLKEIKEGK